MDVLKPSIPARMETGVEEPHICQPFVEEGGRPIAPWVGPEGEGDMHHMHACMHAPGQSIDLPQLYRRPWTAPLEGRRSKA